MISSKYHFNSETGI
ncbi:hypothetical protein BpHYR1_003753 [Brachionus plicatilis]|uniref:Uncharacterized protein n=1 Tax=Brachionus plicatilis TaxID=10195 RepID=A0A3M7P604_BRAPC|nr:hypothetical protein BpHYR1_003753 [Brachionus plicatilis]